MSDIKTFTVSGSESEIKDIVDIEEVLSKLKKIKKQSSEVKTNMIKKLTQVAIDAPRMPKRGIKI